MIETFLAIILLIITFILAIIFAVHHLKKSQYKSLLAWYGFIYVSVMNFGVIILPFDGLPTFFVIKYDQNIANRIYCGLSIINIIVLIFLLFSSSYLQRRRGNSSEIRIPTIKKRFIILYLIAFIAFITVILSPETKELWSALKGILQENNLAYYAGIRSKAFGIYLDPLSIMSYVKLIIYKMIIPLTCLYSFYQWSSTKKKIWLRRWLIMISLWGIIAVLTLQKAPILSLILSNILVVFFVKYEKGKIKNIISLYKKTSIYFITLFIIVLGLYTVLGYRGNIVAEILKRIFLEPVNTTYMHFAAFPDIYPYVPSKILNSINNSKNQIQYDEPIQLAAKAATGFSYNANTSILGTGWARNGYAGVCMNTIFLFGVLAFWDIYLKKNKRYICYPPLISLYLGESLNVLNLGANNILIL